MEIKKLNGTKIGYPYTPTKWTSKVKYEKITVLTISYGGGMGGTSRKEYVKRIKDIENNSIQCFTRIDNKEIKINSKYIVCMEDFTLVSVDYETTNPHTKPKGTVKYLVEDGTRVQCVNVYKGSLR